MERFRHGGGFRIGDIVLRRVTWQDDEGRQYVTLIPEDAPDSDASIGVPVGPPSLSPLGLPKDIEIQLHNELFHRGLITATDVKRRQQDVISALQSALKVAAQEIILLYE